MQPIRNPFLPSIILSVVAMPLAAHDFWLEPSTYRPQTGDEVSLTLRVGENLQGDTLPYIDEWFSNFSVFSDSGERPVDGLMGDDPAGRFEVESPGTHLVGYRSTNSFVELAGQKFHDYLAKEGLESIIETRMRRGEADSSGLEYYSRCAKTLLSAGQETKGTIFNKALGYTLELIPELDPGAMTPGQSLPIQLLYASEPIEHVLIVAFTKGEPEKKISGRTDSDGRVLLNLDRPGIWLIKAVHMIEVPPDDQKADWESFWASLSFQLDP